MLLEMLLIGSIYTVAALCFRRRAYGGLALLCWALATWCIVGLWP